MSSANVTILVIFAALAMPGFVALGDGLAENVTGRGGQADDSGGPSSNGPWGNGSFTSAGGDGNFTTGGGSTGSGGGDYWGGGEDIAFDVARPGATPWEDHNIQSPETFTGGPGDFGDWGQDPVQPTATSDLSASAPGSYGEVPSASDNKTNPFDFQALKSNLMARFGGSDGNASPMGGADGIVSSSLASSDGNAMSPEDAVKALSEYLEANGGRLSLKALQDLAEGGDPELAAAAEYILGDRAIREGLTNGGYAMSAEDLAELAADLQSGAYKQDSWMAGDRRKLDASEIDLAIKNSEDGNPPAWARNSAHVLGSDFDLLADSSGPNGMPRMSSDTLEAVMNMNEQEWADFQANRGIDSNFTLEQVQGAARAAVESGLFDYLDAPPGMGVDVNGLVGREMLLSFSDESQRQGDSWSEYLRDDNATEASASELRNEDGANAIDGEPLVMKAVEGDLFAGTVADDLIRDHPNMASMIRADGLDKQASVSADDVVQGAIGDCWAMSGLAAFAEKDPSVIRDAITDNKDGTYTVRLYDAEGNPVKTTVDNEFAASAYSPDGSLFAQTDRALWVGVMEKAMTEVLDGRNGASDDMMSIDGGHDAMIHQMLTGEEAETVYFSEPTEANASAEFLAEKPKNASVETSASKVAAQLDSWASEGRAITVTSTGDATNPAINANNVTAGHSYTVMGVEEGQITLRDPRGDEFNVTMSIEDFNEAFVSMTSST